MNNLITITSSLRLIAFVEYTFGIKLDYLSELRMKLLFCTCLLLTIVLAACSGWTVRPLPYNPPTPFSSRTPSIYTATPVILPPPITTTLTGLPLTLTLTTISVTSSVESTITVIPSSPTLTPTIETPPSMEIKVDILGCNTGIDLAHGMGEVTNAFVTVSNVGAVDLGNVCTTLNARDEGRPHPDKRKCLPSLSAGYQVTQKLTVDTTYKEATPIQIDVTSNDVLIQRVGKDSCSDIGLFPPGLDDIGIVKRIP